MRLLGRLYVVGVLCVCAWLMVALIIAACRALPLEWGIVIGLALLLVVYAGRCNAKG